MNQDIELINEYLDKYLKVQFPQVIWEAMRYSVLAKGKRLRPILVLESARVCGGNIKDVLPTACAIEMLHCQSLIHDDLPCMDNDDYRRGQLTNHKVYGEANAVLTGDALLSLAPQVILRETPGCVNRVKILQVLDEFFTAAGAMGIVGGQFVDIDSEDKDISLETFNYILNHKTGELFKFALRSGAILSGAPDNKLRALTIYGEKIGYAFQIADDILDVIGTLEEIGKTPGKDLKLNKNTYVSFYGIEKSKTDLINICETAVEILVNSDLNSPLLIEIADKIKKKATL